MENTKTNNNEVKVLIFTMTCGEGHNMIAKSISQAFNANGAQTKIVQTFGYNEKRVARENKKFLWACKHIPHLYNFVWNKLRKKNHYTNKLPSYVKFCLPHFLDEINNFNPNIIICTHYYASSVISYIKKNNLIDKNIITSTILTDFCVHPYWEHSINVDYIIQALKNTTSDLIKKGFTQEQIYTTGMPIRETFYKPYNKEQEKQKLKLQGKIVTIVGGGNGLGNTLKLVKSIIKEKLNITIIVINGKNVKNYNKINKFINKNKINNIINLGFINNIDEYMKSSDIIITRCGSSCLSECISLQIPFIMREKMILNEQLNKELFIKLGCGIGMNKITEGGSKVKYLLENENIYTAMKTNISKIQHPYSAQKIVEFLLSKEKDEK